MLQTSYIILSDADKIRIEILAFVLVTKSDLQQFVLDIVLYEQGTFCTKVILTIHTPMKQSVLVYFVFNTLPVLPHQLGMDFTKIQNGRSTADRCLDKTSQR